MFHTEFWLKSSREGANVLMNLRRAWRFAAACPPGPGVWAKLSQGTFAL